MRISAETMVTGVAAEAVQPGTSGRLRNKGVPDLRLPSENCIAMGQAAVRRAGGRDAAPICQEFIRSSEGGHAAPAARLVSGGQGGAVRLKLYLSALYIASREPHQTDYPSRAWAELLDLSEPDGNGARRIGDAIHWLEAHRFVRVRKRRGSPTIIFLMDDGGSGRPYKHPADLKRRYVQLPSGFWSSGWIGALSGAALWMLLVLLDMRPYPDQGRPVWVSPRLASERYTLSPDTWTRARKELEGYGLIQVTRQPIGETDFDWRRRRNSYSLNIERLAARPEPRAEQD